VHEVAKTLGEASVQREDVWPILFTAGRVTPDAHTTIIAKAPGIADEVGAAVWSSSKQSEQKFVGAAVWSDSKQSEQKFLKGQQLRLFFERRTFKPIWTVRT